MSSNRLLLSFVFQMESVVNSWLLVCGWFAGSLMMATAFSTDDFAKPALAAGRFENPKSFKNWAGIPGAISIFKWQYLEKNNESVPTDEKELNKTLPVYELKKFASKGSSKLFAAWLGHATMLVNMEGAIFLTDPIWAPKASWMGSARYRPPPMKLEDLPKIDFAVLSHDHYDHLDSKAVARITEMNPEIQWFTPLGMRNWLKTIVVESNEAYPNRVTEMNWGDNVTVTVRGIEYTIWCLPSQHWGQRGPFDRNWRLWSGWAVISPSRRFYYTGDTGFCDSEFVKIGRKLGPFDLSAIAIGAYEPRWFMKSQHINPEEAIKLHELVRSKMSIGIHWGTYHLGSYEFYMEPKEKLHEMMSNRTDLYPFITIEMGEIWEEEVAASPTKAPKSR